MTIITKVTATFFGIGYTPIAPGTMASLVVVLLYRLVLFRISWPLYLLICGLVYAMGVWASSRYARHVEKQDPGTIVIDEVLGQMLALFAFAPTWWVILVNFLLFRFFDIVKPFYIRKAENFSGGWGIMLDDILAGLYASIVLNIIILLR